jgi:hypothetical protein
MSMSDDAKRQQREHDKNAFLDQFRAHYTWGQTWGHGAHELERLLEFLKVHRCYYGRPPENNRQLEEVLERAVEWGSIVPVIEHHAYPGGFYVPPARTQPAIALGRGPEPEPIFTSRPGSALRRGEPILAGPYDPSTQEAKLIAARAAMSTGGLAEIDDVEESGVAAGGISTPLSNTQPFQYRSFNLDADVTDLAARGLTGAEEAECDAMYEARMIYCNALSKMYGGDTRTYLACKERAFQDYQTCRGY